MKRKKIVFILLLVFIVVWSTLLYIFGATKLVSYFGVHNGYILSFFIASFGGFSSLTSTSFFLTFVTLVKGGLNPLILSVLSGIGLSLGDSFFFYFGYNGRSFINKRVKKKIDKFSDWLETRKPWAVPIIAFIYAGLTPLPNDILMMSTSLAGIKFKRIILFVTLGNIVATLIVAYFVLAI